MYKIPDKKVLELLKQINVIAFSKKVTLKQLQSLCGILAFCSRALPAGRAFSRRLYMATAKASKPYHYIRVSRNLKAKYINTAFNSIADALSRAQFQKFKELAPHTDSSPMMMPYEFLIFLNDNIKV